MVAGHSGCTSVDHTRVAPVPKDGGVVLPESNIEGGLDAPILLVYTSGTTGQPKGVLLTQQALLVNALNSVDMHELTPADHILPVLPMFHVGGLNIHTTPGIYVGATITIHQRFDPAKTLLAIEKERPNLLVPVSYTHLTLPTKA